MHITQQQEQFSKAYVRAIAAVTGLRVSEPEVDDDSIDMTLAARGGNQAVRSAKLDLQLKCLAQGKLALPHLSYQLKIKNYDDLRDTGVMVPRVLVVVVIPKQPKPWLLHNAARLTLYHCAYWISLRGMAAMPGQNSVVVKLPRSQYFSVTGVGAIMNRIASGGLP